MASLPHALGDRQTHQNKTGKQGDRRTHQNKQACKFTDIFLCDIS